ncbi:hypothetical protein BAZSYMA_ACONTIG03627_8 [Bathymodiolus azoricus thioautotrophic gill symbiont]|uniref:Uncharacterized protein n=1 Tax=Bathymodiolus azoricus thioautotrophic gill symbiont TaxID=235205 RepID=A0A1H6K6R1_9GAMM|nr:hypothetical protein BAZSYMA_ACONTIG03627_8 [Bathymodiolus azoricus thioautotrophic gill symbiont]
MLFSRVIFLIFTLPSVRIFMPPPEIISLAVTFKSFLVLMLSPVVALIVVLSRNSS